MSEYYKRDLEVDFNHFVSPNTGASERALIQLQDLVNRIEDELAHCKKQKEKYPRMQQYSDKVSVLNATKNYVCGNIGLDTLEEYMRMYPKWDKDSKTTDGKTLIDEAMTFKGDP